VEIFALGVPFAIFGSERGVVDWIEGGKRIRRATYTAWLST